MHTGQDVRRLWEMQRDATVRDFGLPLQMERRLAEVALIAVWQLRGFALQVRQRRDGEENLK
jgi:hypothetical protein